MYIHRCGNIPVPAQKHSNNLLSSKISVEMVLQSGVTYIAKGKLRYMGPAGVLDITDIPARIILALNQQEGGMSGAQLAKSLGVTPSAVSKAAKELLGLRIIRREDLPVSPNVKLYSLVVKVKTEEDFDNIRKNVSPTLIDILTKRLQGDENLALIYAWELDDYLKSLSASERGAVMQKVMGEITGRGIKNDHP